MTRQKSQQAKELDSLLAEAVLGVNSGVYKSSYAAAKVLGLRPNTVLNRVKGGSTRQQARQQQQNLTPTQEETLLKWIKQLTITGYAPTHSLLREMAEEIRCNPQYQNNPDASTQPRHPLGKKWVQRFLTHHQNLKSLFGRQTEMQRMNGATEPVLKDWFNAYKDIVAQFNIQEKDVYNMDETGFSICTLESTRIIVDSTYQTRHRAHSGRQELL